MSGRKLSEVKASLEQSAHLVTELGRSETECDEVCSELGEFGLDTSPYQGRFQAIRDQWKTLVTEMGKLKKLVSDKATRNGSHYFDSEYSQAEKLASAFRATVDSLRSYIGELRGLLSVERKKHLAAVEALQRDLGQLEKEVDSREVFVLIETENGVATAAEFAEKIGLGANHLDEVFELLKEARAALDSNDLEDAKTKVRSAWELWNGRKNALKALHDSFANDVFYFQKLEEFFVEKGFDVHESFEGGQLCLVASHGKYNKYSAKFRPLINQTEQKEHIVWDTPEGSGCIPLVKDLNAHFARNGILHRFEHENRHRKPDSGDSAQHRNRKTTDEQNQGREECT